MRVARRAGTNAAAAAATVIARATIAKVAGSSGFTSKRKSASRRESANAIARPSAMPVAIRLTLRFITMPTTSPGCAPRARRIPISRVRREVGRLHIGDNTDHGQPGVRTRAVHREAPSDRIAAGPASPRDDVADDGDTRRTTSVAPIEMTAAQQSDPERSEVVVADRRLADE